MTNEDNEPVILGDFISVSLSAETIKEIEYFILGLSHGVAKCNN